MGGTQELLCDGCGAPLDVGDKARFVTCSYCGTRLRIKHSDSAAWTEKVERIAENQQRIEKQQRSMAAKQRRLERELAISKLRDELEALEREWVSERERYMVRQKSGELRPPDEVLRQIVWITAVAAPLLAIFAATQLGAVGLLIGAAPALAMGFQIMSLDRKAKEYRLARARYEEEHERLTSAIQALHRKAQRRGA